MRKIIYMRIHRCSVRPRKKYSLRFIYMLNFLSTKYMNFTSALPKISICARIGAMKNPTTTAIIYSQKAAPVVDTQKVIMTLFLKSSIISIPLSFAYFIR